MKKVSLMLMLILLMFSCTIQKNERIVQNEGDVVVKNGMNDDTITYKCYGCQELLDTTTFDKVVIESTLRAKNNLNIPLSFVPISMKIMVSKNDSLYDFETNEKIKNLLDVYIEYDYIGKNAFGTEMSGKQQLLYSLVDGDIINISDTKKLDSLKFNEDDYINRTLIGYNNDEYIEFIPLKKKRFIVNSSISCVDENSTFIVFLENEKEVELKSWNSFNCDGNMYFDFYKKSQIDELKSSKIKYLYVYSRGNSVMVSISKNQSDYFQQLFNLY